MRRKTPFHSVLHRPLARGAGVCLVFAALLAGGCSLGYRNLHPDEDSALYAPLFEDIITRFDAPEWLWTRGTIAGDFNINGKADEEAVIATIQAGDDKNPGPILEAFLTICRIEDNGSRTAIARIKLFDRNPIDPAVKVANNAYPVAPLPFTNVRAQVVNEKLKIGDGILVYFWNGDRPANVWAALYKLENDLLVKKLDIALCQATPGFLQANLDRRIDPNTPGYQLVFSSAALPGEVVAKMGDKFVPPLWGHVFSPDRNGNYFQCDKRFGSYYERVENSWNQAYLEAVMLRHLDAADLAWFEYHLGMLNHFLGRRDLALTYLKKAKAGAREHNLSAAIDTAISLISKSESDL